MKVKGILVIAIIVSITLIVVLLPSVPEGLTPDIRDAPEISDSSEPEIGTIASDAPSVEDSATFTEEQGASFYLDENGTKHYVIDAKDVPQIGDQ